MCTFSVTEYSVNNCSLLCILTWLHSPPFPLLFFFHIFCFDRDLASFVEVQMFTCPFCFSYPEDVVDSLATMDHNKFDLDLGVELIKYICFKKPVSESLFCGLHLPSVEVL